jgi:hypothetical protein
METKHVISKSAKRKMSTLHKTKANSYTQMVVYKTKIDNVTYSRTVHEKI